jgi:uncharacterized MnhB-related membrane protein
MLKSKFNRHVIAFSAVSLASIFLYPLAEAGLVTLTWVFLGLAVLAAILTILTK